MKKQPTSNHSAVPSTIENIWLRAAQRSRFGRHVGLNALALAATAWVAFASPLPAAPMSPAFTYQGRLYDNGSSVSGSYDLLFTLLTGPNMALTGCPNPITLPDVPVTNGVFSISLPFCKEAFDGSDRWLQIAVRPAGVGDFSPLGGPQKITATPYSIHADSARTAETAARADTATQADTAAQALNLATSARVPWSSLMDVPAGIGTTYSAGAGLSLSGSTFGLDANTLSGSRYDGRFWKLGGNASVPSGMNLFGTATNLPLDLIANNQRILRLEPTASSPNLIGGYSGNFIAAGAVGGTVSGGGNYWTGTLGLVFDERNRVTDNYGSVGGGNQNQAGNNSGTTSDASYTTVGGGHVNTAAGQASTVSGGDNNYAGGAYAAIVGGAYNRANGNYSFAAGRRAKAMNAGSFVWADSTDVDYSSTANDQFSVRASGGIRLDGDIFTSNHDVHLHDAGNLNHGIGYRNSVGDNFIDGSFIYGYNGGALGTSAPDSVAVTWNWLGDVACARDLSCARDLACARDVSVGRNLSTATLTIRGGADLAEPFKMSGETIPPGAVVVIDEENPGHLKMSGRAYDRQVAGIVSGANGVNPGISLHQEGTLEGGQNVALTGRVYVQADATFGAIKPGDLLTTSDTPGHAMKVTDHARSQGAILGKAMTGLESGRDFVLVLVTLQ